MKYLFLFVCVIIVFSMTGCTAQNADSPAASFSAPDPVPQPAPTDQSKTPTVPPIHQEGTPTGKELLELEDYLNNPISLDFEDGSLLSTKSIALPHTPLDERKESPYNGEPELAPIVSYIKDTLNVEIDSKWKVFVHYYDADKTVGMVQFIYTVGEINTNRSILFNINGNKYDTVYYKCLTEAFHEADLLQRVNSFKNRYVQGKRELQEGESFYEEQTNFTYFIHSHKLVYSYAYFFQYDIGVINNDWGTVRIIDENGTAISIP